MEVDNIEQPKAAYLWVLKDDHDKPLHMRVVRADYNLSQAQYRDEAAAAVLKQSPDVLD